MGQLADCDCKEIDAKEYSSESIWIGRYAGWGCPTCKTPSPTNGCDHVHNEPYGLHNEMRTYFYTCKCGTKYHH